MAGEQREGEVVAVGSSGKDEELIPVRVVVRSQVERVEWSGGELKVWVSAPPLGGRANRAVAKVVGRALGCRQGAVEIVSGERSSHKRVRIAGWSVNRVRESLQRAQREG